MDEALISTALLTEGWRLTRSDAAANSGCSDVDWSKARSDAVVPGTVASTLIGAYDPDRYPEDNYDDYDWWYECDFDVDDDTISSDLVFDGLATIADAWLNGKPILQSRNMYRAHRVDVSGRLSSRNTLTIAFRSINRDLKQKRPRPKWKTNLIGNQQLRWIRTTLLGRIPGWTPPIAPVGPWRNIRLEQFALIRPREVSVLSSVSDSNKTISVQAILETVQAAVPDAVALTILGKTHALTVEASPKGVAINAHIDVDDAEMWSPQCPALHDYVLSIRIGGRDRVIQAGKLGFRSSDVDRCNGNLGFQINGQDIFCRGACWTTNDIVSLSGNERRLRECLDSFRSCGGNMIRVGGTMVYESDAFYCICDELGIMVWQDFMFANMDYPSSDPVFLDDAVEEITQQVKRLRAHSCVVAWCGNSEVEQQSAMFGTTPDLWRNELFYATIPKLLEQFSPGIPYFPSSPCEGALPFHNATGPSHYFGVGAYKQPLASVVGSDIKFTSECLAFSNVPCDRSLIEHFKTPSPPVHHPRWKAGVPRDSAAGWDFEDIRDYYIKELYDVDPIKLRYAEKDRYFAISQVVTGEVMEHVFNYWRGSDSRCNGGLIWQLMDMVPGAGWGILDSDGRPKPLYYFLQRCWGNIHFAIEDRGLDGLRLCVGNESGQPLAATLNLQILHHSKVELSNINQCIELAPGERTELSADEILGRFFDTTYSYRFGPPKHDVVVASLVDGDGAQILTRSYFPGSRDIHVLDRADLSLEISAHDDGKVQLSIHADSFLQHVKLFSRSHEFDDNYFHLAPGLERKLTAKPVDKSGRPFRGTLTALNLSNPVALK